jgi:hypothetical protein
MRRGLALAVRDMHDSTHSAELTWCHASTQTRCFVLKRPAQMQLGAACAPHVPPRVRLVRALRPCRSQCRTVSASVICYCVEADMLASPPFAAACVLLVRAAVCAACVPCVLHGAGPAQHHPGGRQHERHSAGKAQHMRFSVPALLEESTGKEAGSTVYYCCIHLKYMYMYPPVLVYSAAPSWPSTT